MSLRYKKKKIVLCFDKENKVEKYVAANVLAGSLNYKKLCDEVNQRTGIHRSMVDVVLKGLQDTMVSFLEEGFRLNWMNLVHFVQQSMQRVRIRRMM